MARMYKTMSLATLLGVVVTLLFAGQANAAGYPPPKVKHSATQTVRVGSVTFSGESFARGEVTILADMNLRAGVNVNDKRCFWTKPGQKWSNGGYGAGGVVFEEETTPAKLCPSKKARTGWVKVAGGRTGRPCFNEAKVGKAPGPVAKGRVIWVSNFNIQMNLRAHERFRVTAICGFAEGQATATIQISLRVVMRTRGQAVLRFFGSVKAKAWAKARARLKCTPLPKTPPAAKPPVTPPVQVGRLVIQKITDKSDKSTNDKFRVCVKTVNKSLTLCYIVSGGQTVPVRNRGKDVLFSPGVQVDVCEDRAAGWVTPSCQRVRIVKGVNTVTIRNRRLVEQGKVCVTKRTFEDGSETTGRVDRIVNFVIDFRGQRFSLPNDGRVYCFADLFTKGAVLPVTEVDAKGFTPDAPTISVTAGGAAGEFINRKVTPPPPPPPVQPKGDKGPEPPPTPGAPGQSPTPVSTGPGATPPGPPGGSAGSKEGGGDTKPIPE